LFNDDAAEEGHWRKAAHQDLASSHRVSPQAHISIFLSSSYQIDDRKAFIFRLLHPFQS
jgi:hypothetical protein